MPSSTVAVMTLFGSSTESGMVLTVRVLVAEFAAMPTDVGGVPLIMLPVSVTESVTVNAAAVLPVRVRVKAAFCPSVTDVLSARMLTFGVKSGAVGVALAELLSSLAPNAFRARIWTL